MKKNILILTGASGFVGRHVLEKLADNAAYEVHCIRNRQQLPLNAGNIYEHKIDLLDFSDKGEAVLKTWLKEIKADSCMHLAWYTGHKDYLTSDLNLEWQKASCRLIKYFYEAGGKRLLSTGTCVEYSLKEAKPQHESETPLLPETLYAQCKVNVLNYLMELQATHHINYLWARLYFIYGPGEQPTRLVPYIVNAIRRNEHARPNHGAVYRDYIYVRDLARQLILLLESETQGVINTGSEKPVLVQEIFDTIGQLMGKPELIDKGDAKPNETVPYMIAPDTTRLNACLGKFRYIPLTEGLKETIESYWLHEK